MAVKPASGENSFYKQYNTESNLKQWAMFSIELLVIAYILLNHSIISNLCY